MNGLLLPRPHRAAAPDKRKYYAGTVDEIGGVNVLPALLREMPGFYCFNMLGILHVDFCTAQLQRRCRGFPVTAKPYTPSICWLHLHYNTGL